METNWKALIIEQLKSGVRSRSIHPQLAELIRDLLKENRKFVLLYNHSREQYMGFQYREENRKFANSTKSILLKLIRAEISGAKEELQYRIKNKLL